MNPHHFLFSEAAALAKQGVSSQRPMDEMEVRADSPQEDEFAFLSLGARSPYEALLIPQILPEALKLSDPKDLSPRDEKHWREVFMNFLGGVSVRGGGRPMILKSPTHGARVDTIRELLPDARFILIVRDPLTNFESVVRMWRKMFETYAIAPIPAVETIREAVLVDRPRFEAKLARSTGSLPENRFAALTYESLVANPVGIIEGLYRQLELGDFEVVRKTIGAESERRREYRATGALPSDLWRDRLASEWTNVFERYASLRRQTL